MKDQEGRKYFDLIESSAHYSWIVPYFTFLLLATCIANSLSTTVEVTHRVMKIILEEPLSEGPILDVDDLLKKYRKRCGAGRETFDVRALFTMLRVYKVDGVKDMV